MLMSYDVYSYILNITPELLKRYYPFDELSGGSVIDRSIYKRVGILQGPTLKYSAGIDRRPSIYFDGVNDSINLFDGMVSDVGVPTVGTIHLAFKSSSGVWTDGAYRYMFELHSNINNRVSIFKLNTNNQFQVQLVIAGNSYSIVKSSFNSLAWNWLTIRWKCDSVPGNMQMFLNGDQVGTVTTISNVWSPIDIDSFVLGQAYTGGAFWKGSLSHFVMSKYLWSDQEIKTLHQLR